MPFTSSFFGSNYLLQPLTGKYLYFLHLVRARQLTSSNDSAEHRQTFSVGLWSPVMWPWDLDSGGPSERYIPFRYLVSFGGARLSLRVHGTPREFVVLAYGFYLAPPPPSHSP